jgi:superkiller protein 3
LPQLRAVVRVIAEIPTGNNVGSGWVYRRDGETIWVVTSRYVVSDFQDSSEPSQNIEVEFFSQNEMKLRRPAEVVRMTEPTDALNLAVLKVSRVPEDIQPLDGSVDGIHRNSDVLLIGHPVTGLPWTVARGSISGLNRRRLQVEAFLAPGMGGAPVFDGDKRVIGMLVETVNPNQPGVTAGYGFAYPMAILRRRLEQWEMGGELGGG